MCYHTFLHSLYTKLADRFVEKKSELFCYQFHAYVKMAAPFLKITVTDKRNERKLDFVIVPFFN